MASEYRYKITPAANRDLDSILAYIANELHAPQSAAALLDKVIRTIEAACAYPQSHPLLEDPLLALRGYRKIVISNYLALYLIAEEEKALHIVRIVYGRRDYPHEL